jgi:transglutaminase-like putative cysteine protease
VYAPRLIADRFDASRQRWLPVMGYGSAFEGRGKVGEIRFQGRLPGGEVQLPVPLHGRPGPVSAGGATLSPVRSPEGAWMIELPGDSDLRYEVTLGASPQFVERATPLPPELLARTAPDSLLPAAVHEFLSGIDHPGISLLDRALKVREFIRDHYRYDPSYLEDQEISDRLAIATRSSPNAHLEALHAGRDGRHLGAGVCYELNALACELLRRAGVPAAICTGWVLTGHQLSEPDHLWALALLPTADGLRWLPIDASTTRDGTPLTVASHPAGAFRAPAGARRLRPLAAPAAPAAPARGGLPPELVSAVRRLEQMAGEEPMDDPSLRRRLAGLLADPDEARRLLAWLRGS